MYKELTPELLEEALKQMKEEQKYKNNYVFYFSSDEEVLKEQLEIFDAAMKEAFDKFANGKLN